MYLPRLFIFLVENFLKVKKKINNIYTHFISPQIPLLFQSLINFLQFEQHFPLTTF